MTRHLARRLVPALIASACAGSSAATPASDKPKKPVELRPVLGDKNVRSPELPVTDGATGPVQAVAITGGTLLLGTGKRIENGTIVLENGRITAVGGADVAVPAGARRVDARDRFITPGLIDTHSHLGVYASPGIDATADGNEMTDPTTPYVYSEHSFWPQDPAILRAVAGGITALQILPGSGNVIGGRAVTLKLRPQREARAMRFPGAPDGLKMACGENPKRVYGESKRQPMSRMGSISMLRRAFIRAQAYRHGMRSQAQDREAWQKKYEAAKGAKPGEAEDPGKEPYGADRDIGMETLADVLDGKIKVHVHCYRADEMLLMIALSKELGFKISSFHHAVEAYKIADVLAREQIGASLWADWWGFKLEAWDGIEENIGMVAAAGGRPIVHSDSSTGIQRLNQEASKALHAARRAGLDLSEDQAIQWITLNPAWALGVDEETGSLEAGKMADVVVWDRNPLSIYARAEQVYSDGALVFDRAAPPHVWSDFEVGTDVEEVVP